MYKFNNVPWAMVYSASLFVLGRRRRVGPAQAETRSRSGRPARRRHRRRSSWPSQFPSIPREVQEGRKKLRKFAATLLFVSSSVADVFAESQWAQFIGMCSGPANLPARRWAVAAMVPTSRASPDRELPSTWTRRPPCGGLHNPPN
jgi:hypothetical protein